MRSLRVVRWAAASHRQSELGDNETFRADLRARRASLTAPSLNSFGYGFGMNTGLPEASDDSSHQLSTKAREVQALVYL